MSPLGQRNYIALFIFMGMICFIGLFIPLMDNDAAHHANIALHMYLSGDYVNLIDNGKDYLDKPHLHFWLAAISYQVFGVNEFAYKFPSFLLGIGGLFSLYKLGRLLFDAETGRLSALIMATAFSFFLSQADVRMDAILVAAICFSCWQLLELVINKQWIYVLGAALGMAIGFSVKGTIGVLVPAIFLFWYLAEKKQWGSLLSLRIPALLILFFLFISPVLYCYYLQFDLHPEKIIRGKDHITGVKFALFGGGIERFSGEMSQDGKKDWLFFLYTFLWAFAPWSIITYLALVRKIKLKKDWFISATIISLALMIGISGSKLPHYLNISFPFAALLTANYLHERPLTKPIRILLYSLMGIFLASNYILNGWLFPEKIYRLAVFTFLIMNGSFLSSKTAADLKPFSYLLRSVLFLYLFMALGFYPKLLTYQAGQELAEKIDPETNRESIYFWKDNYSSSFCFATRTLRKEWTDTSMTGRGPYYLVYDISYEKQILEAGLVLGEKLKARDFEITKLDKAFLDPKTREAHCSQLVMAKIDSVRKLPGN